MFINLLLLLLVFGATRWKKHPYLGALALALVKGGLYLILPLRSSPLWVCALNGALGFLLFGGLGAGLVYFIRRLDRYEPQVVSYSSPGAERVPFKWEYIPLAVIVLAFIFAETLAVFVMQFVR